MINLQTLLDAGIVPSILILGGLLASILLFLITFIYYLKFLFKRKSNSKNPS